jgi:hypothetical protein
LGSGCVYVADHDFKAGEESRAKLKPYIINSSRRQLSPSNLTDIPLKSISRLKAQADRI